MEENNGSVAGISLAELQQMAVSATVQTSGERERQESPNYAAFLESDSRSYVEVLGENATDFPSQVREVLRRFVLLPRADFQWKIVASYLSLPLAHCAEITKWDIPILFSQGLSGSGKSTVGHLACELHGLTPISAGSSFAALRNTIKKTCFWEKGDGTDLDQQNNWKNSSLIWEDINPKELQRSDGLILNLLKNGVSRTGTIFMATLSGENLEFPVYCPKFISSIHAIYAGYEFRELVRRVIVIQHKPYKLWKSTDHSDFYHGIEPGDIYSRLDYDWSDFGDEFRRFWNDDSVIQSWIHHARVIRSTRNHGLEDVHWGMSKHLILCGVTCGYWLTVKEASEHFREYWDWHRVNIELQASATQKELEAFIDSQLREIRGINSKFVELGLGTVAEEKITSKAIRDHLIRCNTDGRLDSSIQNRDVALIMANLGWELRLGDWVRIQG